MAQHLSFGSVFVGKTAGAEQLAAEQPKGRPVVEQPSDSPMRILILGNFCGAAGDRTSQAGSPRPTMIDRDNLDEVLAKFHPALRLEGVHPDGSAVEIEFSELDDFHPDRLYERLPLFDTLRETRERLENPATFAAAATEVRGWGTSRSAASAGPPAQETDLPDIRTAEHAAPPAISGENLLDQVIAQSEGSSPKDSAQKHLAQHGSSVFDLLLEKVAGPYRIAADDPDKQPLLELVDALAADRLRAILHHPEFQSLEAAWRGLDFLVRRIETDANLKLFVLNLPKAALAADLEAVAMLRSSLLYKLLADLPAGSAPWTLVAGNYSFAATRDDVETLGRITQIAASAAVPFIAAAETSVFGCRSPAERPDPDDWSEPEAVAAQMWQQLRSLPAASSLGLAAPRFLLRQPYGPDSNVTECLEFVELPTPEHEWFLWGNPAFVAVCLLAQAFSRNGWNLSDDLGPDIDDLPVYAYDDGGELTIKPCAEGRLGDRAVERILEFGIMPLESFADRGSVRLGRFQSLADPPKPLAGRWQ